MNTLKLAMTRSVPIFAGYLFLGMSCGMFAVSKGLPVFYPILMSFVVYAGSMEFLSVSLLLSAFNPLAALIVTLMVNARHLFYGLALLVPFRQFDWRKFIIVLNLSDETFVQVASMEVPENIDKQWYCIFLSCINHLYWIIGITIGTLVGGQLPFDTRGIEFVLVALFLVNLLEQLLNMRQYFAVAVGVGCGIVTLLSFGKQHFMIPAMIAMLIIFSINYRQKGGIL